MSVHVMALCFRAKFGNPYLKAVALALADHAHDDGSNIWPSVASVAEKTEIAPRTVQYKLRELEDCGLIACVAEGGKGPKDTREYRFDMQMLCRLAMGEAELVSAKGASDAPLEGAPGAPILSTRVQPTTLRVQLTTVKGAPGAPEPSLNHQEPSARVRASDLQSSPARNAQEKQHAAIRISPRDISWRAWIDHLHDQHNPELAARAEAAGEMVVDKRWPEKSEHAPIIPHVHRDSVVGKMAAAGDAA